MSVIADLPDIRPSLLLDFANSGRVDPRVSCVRASTATCHGPDGGLRTVANNVPRIDYDTLTGKCLGLLAEEARTNLALYSSDWTLGSPGAGWSHVAASYFRRSVASDHPVILGNVAEYGPLSGISAFTNEVNRQYFSASLPAGWYTLSIDLKAVGICTTARVLPVTSSGSAWGGVVDLTTGDVLSTSNSGTDVESTFTIATRLLGNGWVRVTLTFNALVALSTFAIRAFPYIGNNAMVGDGVSGLRGTRAQLEAGACPTSYIPTTSLALVRAADLLQIDYALPTVGAVVSSVAGMPTANAANAYIWSAHNPADTNADHAYTYFSGSSNRTNWWVNKGGVGQSGGSIAGRPLSIGMSFDATGKAAALAAGSQIAKDTTRPRDFPANLSRLSLGRSISNNGFLGGCISRLAVYSGRITDAQLQRLTT